MFSRSVSRFSVKNMLQTEGQIDPNTVAPALKPNWLRAAPHRVSLFDRLMSLEAERLLRRRLRLGLHQRHVVSQQGLADFPRREARFAYLGNRRNLCRRTGQEALIKS